MKILNEHNGFTTNSSASSEFLGPPPAAGEGLNSEVSTTPTKPKQSPLMDNITMLGGFLMAIVGVFALERFIKRKLKAMKESDDE